MWLVDRAKLALLNQILAYLGRSIQQGKKWATPQV
jgi:hypothetical protein